MKKITLLLMSLILSLGYINAQSELPNPSTDDDGPWYYVRVLGSQNDRENRYWTVETYSDGVDRVFGRHALATSFEDVEKQLFRFEQYGENYQIINKFTGKALDQYGWEAKNNQPVTCLVEPDATSTDWVITDSEKEGYFIITPEIPFEGTSNYRYLHQGNGGFEFCVVLENSTWGTGANSQFYFIEYEDPGLLVPESEPGKHIDFGYTIPGGDTRPDLDVDTITVLGFPTLISDIKLEWDETNPNFFLFYDKDEFDLRQGGFLQVYFTPRSLGEHKLTVTISAETTEGKIAKEVLVEGVAKPKTPTTLKTSPNIANSDQDTWYSIRFDKRTGFYLKDYGVDKMYEAYPGYANQENDPAQLWKFVTIADNDTAFKLVNKLGHQLVYNTTLVEITDDEGNVTEEPINRFYSAATSDNTFSFNVSRKYGDYQIQWNEYYIDEEEDGELTGEKIHRITYLNKTNTDDGFTVYSSLSDDGNTIQLHEYGKGEFVSSDYPETSTNENPIWYYIQFNRPIIETDDEGEKLYPYDGIKSNGIGTEDEPLYVTQGEIDEAKQDESFYWRFEGDWNKFKIIDIDGNEFGVIKDEQTVLVEEGEGAFFKFERFGTTNNWQAQCVDGEDEYNYLNDYKKNQQLVGGYKKGDAGAEIVLTLVSEWSRNPATGIESPAEEMDGTIIGTIYYTIQGIQLTSKPTTEGLYIVKTIYSDKKASAKTIYIKN